MSARLSVLVAPFLLSRSVPQRLSVWEKERELKKERATRERMSENPSGRSGQVFSDCLEKRDWDEARVCSLTSIDCSLGNVPRSCVCVRARACAHSNSSPQP